MVVRHGATTLLLGHELADRAEDAYQALLDGRDPMAAIGEVSGDVAVIGVAPKGTTFVLRGETLRCRIVTPKREVTELPELKGGWRGGAVAEATAWQVTLGLSATSANDEASWPLESGVAPASEINWGNLPRKLVDLPDFSTEQADSSAPRPLTVEEDLDATVHDEPAAVPNATSAPEPTRVANDLDDTTLPPAPFYPQLASSQGHLVTLSRPIVIGRNPDVARAPDPRHSQTLTVASPLEEISRSHCIVAFDAGRVIVWDLNSANGTRLVRNGRFSEALTPQIPAVVDRGDVIDLGDSAAFWIV